MEDSNLHFTFIPCIPHAYHIQAQVQKYSIVNFHIIVNWSGYSEVEIFVLWSVPSLCFDAKSKVAVGNAKYKLSHLKWMGSQKYGWKIGLNIPVT
jgi:hypothetical protein